MERIKVVQFGTGPVGILCAQQVFSNARLELVGAVDIDPEKVGQDVGRFFSPPEETGVIVSNQAAEVLSKTQPAVVLHTTQSSLQTVYPQLETILGAGANVVSSTEELLFPRLKNERLTDQLDALAKRTNVTVLGTGVNPGFVMDTFTLMATAVCVDVRRIQVERFVDARFRRLPLQKKVGAGLSVEEFKELAEAGKMGHVGMKESVALIAYGLAWDLDEIQETLDPMVADDDYRSEFLSVKKGQVAGIKNIGRGLRGGEVVITLDLRMYIGCTEPHDSIHLDSQPPIDLKIQQGVHGDVATVAMLINSVPNVIYSNAGLKTMVDLPVPRYFG